MPETRGALSLLSDLTTIVVGMPLKTAILVFSGLLLLNLLIFSFKKSWFGIPALLSKYKREAKEKIQLRETVVLLREELKVLCDIFDCYNTGYYYNFKNVFDDNNPVNKKVVDDFLNSYFSNYLKSLFEITFFSNNDSEIIVSVYLGLIDLSRFQYTLWNKVDSNSKLTTKGRDFIQRYNDSIKTVESAFKRLPAIKTKRFHGNSGEDTISVAYNFNRI